MMPGAEACYWRWSSAVIGIGTMTPRFAMRVGHNRCMAKAHDLTLALTRVIEPTGEPGAELATLEDAARVVGLVRPWRQHSETI
jgi:hypothetical protein